MAICSALAAAHRSRLISPRSRIRSSAKSRTSRELARSLHGDNRFGLLIRPASVAHSASDISRAGFAKYPRAAPLAYVSGREIFQRRPDDPQQIVAVMLIKFCVLNGNNCVDKIGRQQVVRNCLTVFDIDLAEYFAVPIQNHAG